MKNILISVGLSIYSLIVSYLIWLLFLISIPRIMSFGWAGIVIYWFVGGLMLMPAAVIGVIASIPIAKYANNLAVKIISTVFFLFHGFSAIRLPWGGDIDYNFSEIVMGIFLSLATVVLLGCLMYGIWGNIKR